MINDSFILQNLHKFIYCEETGNLYWSDNFSPRARKGQIVGSFDSDGYRRTTINGKNVSNHRIIWLLHNSTSPEQIDHIDRDVKNNKISNLRASDNTKNQQNASTRVDKKSGQVGVTYKKDKWIARISASNIRYNLGTYSTFDEAVLAYKQAKDKLHVK